MMMRQASAGKYRYGFNGKENDNQVKGLGNQQDYGMRIYDGRLGRFLSVDPITSQYPELTPYQFASNRPIDGIDFDGLEYIKPIPKFEYSGKRTVIDYISAAENGVINLINIVPTTWNSIVATYQHLKKGTYIQSLKNDAKDMGNGIKASTKQFLNAPFKTLTSPESLEFFTTTYLGGKLLPAGKTSESWVKAPEPDKIINPVSEPIKSEFLGGAKGELLSK